MLHKPVELAVIGAGGYSFQLIKRILSVPESGTVTAVTSRDTDSPGARYCRDRGIRVYQNIDELLKAGGFEAVVNPAPIHLHAPLTRQCLEAGYPVLMEKPPVATVQELDALQSVSDATGLPVAVCFNSLFAYPVQQTKRELLAGRFGRIRRIRGIGAWVRTDAYFNRNSWAGKVRDGDDWILDGDLNNPLAHVVCGCLFFAGRDPHALAEPETVQAELYHANEIETEDTSCVRIGTREGVDVMTWLSLASETEIPPRIVVDADEAVITFENFKDLTIEFRDGTVETHEAYQEDRIEMIQQLCRAIRTGERFSCDLRSVRPFTLAVNCAFDSAGSIVAVPADFCSRVKVGDATQTAVDGLREAMLQGFDSGRLFSEMGLPWARPGVPFSAEEYASFPVRFQLAPVPDEAFKA